MTQIFRSEMDVWPDCLWVVAILEAYVRGVGPGLKLVVKQVEMLDKLARLAETLKDYSDSHKVGQGHNFFCFKAM